jgi:hypothetical protein
VKTFSQAMLESYHARKTRRSSRVRLGSVSPVLINPTTLQTRNKVSGEPTLDLRQGNKEKGANNFVY